MAGGAMGQNLTGAINQMNARNQGIAKAASEVGRVLAPQNTNIYRPAVTEQPTTQVSPIVQQMAQRIQMQQNNPFASGLQSLYSQFNVPQQTMAPRAPMQMPVYQNPALNYRPNMQQVQQNLSRVKPSVYKTDLDAARQRIAELEAAQQAQQDYSYYNYG